MLLTWQSRRMEPRLYCGGGSRNGISHKGKCYSSCIIIVRENLEYIKLFYLFSCDRIFDAVQHEEWKYCILYLYCCTLLHVEHSCWHLYSNNFPRKCHMRKGDALSSIRQQNKNDYILCGSNIHDGLTLSSMWGLACLVDVRALWWLRLTPGPVMPVSETHSVQPHNNMIQHSLTGLFRPLRVDREDMEIQ